MKSSELLSSAENVPSEWTDIGFITIDSAYYEGKEEGIEEGIALERERKNRDFVTTLIQNCPDFSDEKIALLAAVSEDFVKNMRVELRPKVSYAPTRRPRRKAASADKPKRRTPKK